MPAKYILNPANRIYWAISYYDWYNQMLRRPNKYYLQFCLYRWKDNIKIDLREIG
jgi:hypothetical protein